MAFYLGEKKFIRAETFISFGWKLEILMLMSCSLF